MCENHLFYGVCGVAIGLNVCESHVFYGVFGIAARSVRTRHIGELTSVGQSASCCRDLTPPVVRHKPLNYGKGRILPEASAGPLVGFFDIYSRYANRCRPIFIFKKIYINL